MAALRDAINIELIDVAGATTALDLSYKVEASNKYGLGSAFEYKQPQSLLQVKRQNGTTPQPASLFDPPGN